VSKHPMSSSSAWTEKYRPTTLADVRGHRRIKKLLESCAHRGCEYLPPLILYGPPGTGKTSLALALAGEAYPSISPSISTLYLNASDERSIEVIRERILQFTQTIWPGVLRKFVIFDEVETMTEPAQASLRALLDDVDREGHKTSPLFLFLCNSLYRVHTAIRSRCVALFCGHVPNLHIRESLQAIQTAEGIPHDKHRIPSEITFKVQRGDMRSFVAAIQYNRNINEWDNWLRRLSEVKQGKSLFVWEEGLRMAPFSILIRHVFIWMEMSGILQATAAVDEFVQACMYIQDAERDTILDTIPPLWEKVRTT
jgi:DNA polymerase III delta prime subunit